MGVDIGKQNLAYAIRGQDGTLLEWALVDLCGGEVLALRGGPSRTVPARGGKRATLEAVIAALVAHMGALDVDGGVARVVIENQLGRANVGAKVISHAVQTFAATRWGAQVCFRRPYGASLAEKMTYAQRKKAAVETAQTRVADDPAAVAFLAAARKKDDLADALLLLDA